MSAKNLKISQLELDLLNPRLKKPADQHEVMQQLLDDQGVKLGNLAESIVEDGLNPMDRLLVIESETTNGKYTVLEGNRRTFVLKILKNPNVLTGLTIPQGLQKKLERIAHEFDTKSLEPIACFQVDSRVDGNTWLEQRHIGEDEGRGIVRWSGVAASRFRGQAPAIQAFDFVRQHGKLTEDQRKLLEGRFPITTLDRLLSTPAVRARMGFEIKNNELLTTLPADEAIKPLRRLVLDLAEKRLNVTKLKLKTQQVDYINKLDPADTPDLKKKSATTQKVRDFTQEDFASPAPVKSKKVRATPKTPRTTVVAKTCKLTIANPKIEEIYEELRSLLLKKHPHAIAVLLRVFLETSVDHFMTQSSLNLTFQTNNGPKDKSLKKKVDETIQHMVANGAVEKEFKAITVALSDANHPFAPELLHAYVHNRFFSPTERDLTTAWDNGQPLFEKIWP